MMVHRRSFLQRLLAAAGAVLCLSSFNQLVLAREPTEVSKTHVEQKGGVLRSRTSLEASRSVEGIRKRLAARGGAESSEQIGSQVAINRLRSAKATCKRHGLERDGGPSAGDVCHVGEDWSGLDKNQSPGQVGGIEEEGRSSGNSSGTQTDDAEHDFTGPSPSLVRENAQSIGFQDSPSPDGTTDSTRMPVAEVRDGVSFAEAEKSNSTEHRLAPGREHDPWQGYQVIAQADAVASWEILRKARLSYYTFKYDRRQGRRQLGVLPTEIASLLPEAFSTFTLPVVLPDGSRSRVEGVPNIDWTYLFSHAVAVTQELSRRYDALDTQMEILKAETENVSLKLVRYMEEQGKEWQPAASLRELAALSELRRDAVKSLTTAEMELNLATILAEEQASLAVQNLHDEEKDLERLVSTEESLRMSTDVALLLLDIEAAVQTARLSSNRRLSESLATLNATKVAERDGEAAEVARIKIKGAEARKQTLAVVDETVALVGSMVLSAVSDPVKLAKIMAALLGVAFVGLLLGNSVTLAARAVRRRVEKPQLVRETDVPGSPPAAAVAWIGRRGRKLLLRLTGKSGRCSGLDPESPEALQGIVLPFNLEQRLRGIATSIRSAYSRGAPLPHVLIHGPPGSGKSVLARRLAKMCDLNTVVVAGGDVGSLGRAASSEIGSLMRWAGGGAGGGGFGAPRDRSGPSAGRGKGKGKGIVMVMDEAEAALGDRRKRGMSENARSALNAVLLSTGELRPGFMMVLTTSRPQDLDEAVLDRVDEVVQLPRPQLAERARLIRQYFLAFLHHDPPIDFLRDSAAREAAAEAWRGGSTNTALSTPDRRENGVSNKERLRTAERRVQAPTKAKRATSPQPELGRGSEVRSPVGKLRGDAKRNRRHVGCGGSGGGGVVRMSEGFRNNMAGLMAMLAVRSEGFYGRDMAHFFSAVQAAVFGSEDCELTEELWASTQSQKLKEFSEKVSMTTTATATATATANAPPDAASKAISKIEPLVQRIRSPTSKMAALDVKREAGGSSRRPLGDSPSPLRAPATADADGESAAPFYSSIFGSGSSGGGVPVEAVSTDIAKVGGGFIGESFAVAATSTPGTAGAPSQDIGAASIPTRSDGAEVETVGWRGALSAPGDPEITHPERVQ